MTYFADLTPYTYLEDSPEHGPALNVGWLDRAHEFRRGPVPADFVASLAELCATSLTNRTRGWHVCNLAGCTSPPEETTGSAEVRAHGEDGKVYAAPTLIHHYVTEHGYHPPDDFMAAVVAPIR